MLALVSTAMPVGVERPVLAMTREASWLEPISVMVFADASET